MDTSQPSPAADAAVRCSCVKCGAELRWSPGAKSLLCAYCGHLQPLILRSEEIVEYDLDFALAGRVGAVGIGARKVTQCGSCGAEFEITGDIELGQCEYCLSSQIKVVELPPRELLPESMAPFAFDEQGAQRHFRLRCKTYPRAPRDFEKCPVVDVRRIYVPFWTFDVEVTAQWEGIGSSRPGPGAAKPKSAPVAPPHQFNDFLVCASRAQRAHQPYATEAVSRKGRPKLVPFDERLLAGSVVERYGLNLDEAWNEGRGQMYRLVERRCRAALAGPDGFSEDYAGKLKILAVFGRRSFKLILMPVYVLIYRYDSANHNVLIDGNTGRVFGTSHLSSNRLQWREYKGCLVGLVIIAALVLLFFTVTQCGKSPPRYNAPAHRGR